MGSLNRVAKALLNETWAITREKLESILTVVEARSEGVTFTKDEVRAAMGAPDKEKEIQVYGGVAVLPLYGTIAKRMNLMTDFSGGTSTEKFQSDLVKLLDDPNVSSIVLDVDSPGGGLSGVEEASQAIYQARGKKPIVAIANDLMASAAYYIASAADEVVTTPTALVGSIGVYILHSDYSERLSEDGVKNTFIYAGDFKTAGNPYQPLDEKGLEVLQERVDHAYGMFVSAVAKNLGRSVSDVKQNIANGKTWRGAQAVQMGLAKRVSTLNDVVTSLAQKRRTVSVKGLVMETISPDVSASLGGTSGGNPNPTLVVTSPSGQVTSNVNPTVVAKAETDAAILAERQRSQTIRGMCNGFWHMDPAKAASVADQLIEAGVDELTAKANIADMLAKERAPVGRIESGESEKDKFYTAMADGFSLRVHGAKAALLETERGRPVKLQTPRKLHPDANMFRGMTMLEMAKEHLRIFGVDTRGKSGMQIAEIANNWRHHVPMGDGGGGGSYMVSRDFPNLLMDAINKTVLDAYMEAPTTYRQWVKIGQSTNDFKTVNLLRLGEANVLEAIPEDEDFPQDKLSDSKVTLAVQRYGKAWEFTNQMLVNDDQSAFTTAPTFYGRAADRTVNQAVYQILTDNASTWFGDSVALFHASHGNLTVTGTPSGYTAGALTVAQLNEMQRRLRVQTGLNSAVTINAEMRYLIVPAAIEGVAKQILASMADPASTNANVPNIWQNRVNVVVDPILDVSSQAVYYGAANPADVPTIEVRFLSGEETPIIESDYDFDRKGRKYTIHLSFAAIPVDYRGMVKNPGA